MEKMKSDRATNSTIFLLPALKITKETWMKHGFINAFIDDKEHDIRYKNALYVLLEPHDIYDTQSFINEQYNSNPLLLEDYNIDKTKIVLVYRFPDTYINEYRQFKQGRYSKFSKKYIELFPMTKKEVREGKSITVSSVFAGIFKKEQWLADYWSKKLDIEILPNEFWSKPDIKEETLRN